MTVALGTERKPVSREFGHVQRTGTGSEGLLVPGKLGIIARKENLERLGLAVDQIEMAGRALPRHAAGDDPPGAGNRHEVFRVLQPAQELHLAIGRTGSGLRGRSLARMVQTETAGGKHARDSHAP